MFKKLFNSVLIYGVGAGLSKSILIFLVPIYTEYFSQEEYGVLEILLSGFLLLCIFGMLQMESALSRYYFDLDSDQKKTTYISTALWTVVKYSLLVAVLASVSSWWISKLLFGTTEYYKHIIILAATVPLTNLYNFFAVMIRFEKKPITYGIVTLTQIVFTVALALFFVIKLDSGIIGVFIAQGIGYIIGFVLYLRYFKQFIAQVLDVSVRSAFYAFALPIFPAVIGSWINNHANRFLMLLLLTTSEIGVYMVAFKVASVFKLGEMAFKMAWNPFYIEHYKDEGIQYFFRKVSMGMAVFMAIIVAISFIFSQQIIDLVANEAYSDAASCLGWLCLAFAIVIMVQLLNLGPVLMKKTKYNTYSLILSITVNLICLFVLVPKLGIAGAAISLVIANLVMLLYSTVISERLYPVFSYKKTSKI